MQGLNNRIIRKFGAYSPIVALAAFSLLPFCFLYEETWLFWGPYWLFFGWCVLSPANWGQYHGLAIFLLGGVVSSLHWHLVAGVDLLFFGRLLLFLLCVLFKLDCTRERAVLTGFVSFVLVLVGGALSYRLWFALYLLIYATIFVRFYIQVQSIPDSLSVPVKVSSARVFFMSCVLIAGGYLLFLLFPRFLLQDVTNQIAMGLAGFSQTMELNEMNNILQSERLMLRVKAPHELYIRGNVLHYFNGKTWSAARRPGNSSYFVKNAAGDFVLDKRTKSMMGWQGKIYEAELQVFPVRSSTLFAPYATVSVEVDLSQKYLYFGGHGVIYLGTPRYLSSGGEYKISYVIPENKFPREFPSINKDMREYYLQLPKNLDPRIVKLANSIAAGKQTYGEKIMAVQNFFSDFRYSLSSYHPGDPISHFLLEDRAGHCEYFATSMVVLLRILGIPARLVNGFAPGEFNPYGGYYAIKQKDAHSWVDVYAGKGRWIEMDPTPASREEASNAFFQWTNGVMGEVNQWLEYLDSRWQEWVLYFSKLDQALFLERLFVWIQDHLKLFFFWLISGFVLFALLLRMVFYYLRVRMAEDPVRLHVTDWLTKRGVEWPVHMPLSQLREQYQDTSEASALKLIEDKIYKARYSKEKSSEKNLLKEIKAILKNL